MRVRLKIDRLAQLLAESSLSQNHWAMKLGLSRGHWSEIVNGKHPFPSARSRERILEAFGVPLDELFTIEPGAAAMSPTDFRMAIGPEYLVDQELRQGGMGSVYLARDHHLRTVAIKVISPEAVSGIGVNQFLKEIATIAHLQHPHILPLFDSGEAAGHPFYVMPYIRSGSLRDRLKRETRFTVDATVELVARIAAALHHAHEHHILHCDVKPENILLDGDHPYVMDFGISRAIHAESFEWGVPRQLDLSAGTPAYVSPEQANGDRDLDGRSDLYSLACVVFEMLSGRPPFEGTTTQAIVARRFLGLAPDLRDYAPEVPAAVVAVIENAMELDRNKRPDTPLVFAEHLRQAARGKSRLLRSAGVVSSRALARVRHRAGLKAPTGITRMLRDLSRDLVLAMRGIRRAPGFALAVILTLGLALGANTTMFGIVDRLLLRAPAFIERPDQVHRVQVARWFTGALSDPAPSLSYPAFLDIRDRTRDLNHVAAVEFAPLSFGTGTEAEEVEAVFATGQYFALLGVRPALGRFFTEEEDRPPSGVAVVVLSHGFWTSHFAGDSAVVGRTLSLNGRVFEVIGVTPKEFTGTEIGQADLWVPFTSGAAAAGYGDDYPESRGSQFLQVFVRVKDGMPLDRVDEDVRRAYHEGHAEMREYEAKAVASLAPLIAARSPKLLSSGEGRVAAWLLGVAAIVLLIACANVANLMLARGVARRAEIAVRQALGVSRGRLFRQLMTESLLLALLGGLTGLALASASSRVIRSVILPDVIWGERTLDARMLGATAIATIVAAVLAGLFPLLRTARGDLAGTLHGSTRTSIGHSRRLRMGLLLAQTSLCTVLIIGAGLFVRSMNRVATLDMGFEPDSLLRVEVDLSVTGMSDAEKILFFRSAAERVTQLPGVRSTALSIGAPFLTNYATGLRVPGLDTLPRLRGGGPYYFRVSASFLETIGGRLVQGRSFTAGDDEPGAAPVTVLTSRMANALWPNQNALEKCIIIDDGACSQVVGIIADVHRQGIEEDPFMLYFVPLGARGTEEVPQYLLVRGSVAPLIEPIRRSLSELRANLPYVSVKPFQELIDRQAQPWRMGSAMFMIFGGLSLVIAAVGLYGVLSYSVTQRTHELGIRSAIGATPGHLRRMIITSGLVAAAVGVGIGTVAALLLSRPVQTMLFQTSARDPLVYGGAAGLVLVIAVLASAIPGVRATRIDPLRALRAE